MSDSDLPARAEVVVIGAGHNSLVAAAYLADAGLEVLVLEAGATVGGNTRTEELTLPGFAHDSCSSAHVLIQNNPWIEYGFALDKDTLPKNVEQTHFSLFDGSNCGIALKDKPVFSVQYHPEASPGPRDSHYLFDRFADLMRAKKRA